MSMSAFEDTVLSVASAQGINCNSILQSSKMVIIYADYLVYGGGLHSHANSNKGLYVCAEKMNYPHDVFMTIGINCHEFAHVLVIGEDDYTGSYPYGYWGLMCDGTSCGASAWGGECPSPLTPDQRYRLGQILGSTWLSYTEITTPQTVQLIFNTTYGLSNVYKVTPLTQGAYPTDYILIENRQVGTGTKWNRFIHNYPDEDGLLIWRLNESTRDLIEADLTYSLHWTQHPTLSVATTERGDAFPGSGGKTYLTDYSTPSIKTISDGRTNIQISNISPSGSGLTTTMTASIANCRFGDLPENETWTASGSHYIGGDFTIPYGKTLSLSRSNSLMILKMYPSVDISVSGTLSISGVGGTEYSVTLRANDTSQKWSGLTINSGGSLSISNTIMKIQKATTGLSLYSANITKSGEHVNEISDCDCGIYIYGCSPTVQWTKVLNNTNDAVEVSGYAPVLQRTRLTAGGNGISVSSGYTPVLQQSKIESVGLECIYLGYCASVSMANNQNDIIRKQSPAGYYAINHGTAGLVTAYVDNNYWGGETNPNLLFSWPSYVNYTNLLTTPFNLAPAKIAAGYAQGFSDALEMEESGNWNGALDVYYSTLRSSADPSERRMAIYSVMRVLERNSFPYDTIKSVIQNEMKYATSWYKESLDFLFGDILSREGKHREAIEYLTARAGLYKGSPMEVQMLSHAAYISGDKLKDKMKAKQLADRASTLNPGDITLYAAYQAAGETYEPSKYEDLFAGKSRSINTPPEPIANTDLTEFVSVSPNPANPVTTITYSSKNPSTVRLSVFSINGQKVATLVGGPMSAGAYAVTFDGSKYASGVYFYRFESAGLNKSGKMLLLK